MIPAQLAQLSTQALYASMAALACAMVAFAVQLARLTPREQTPATSERVLVGAGASAAGADGGDTRPGDAPSVGGAEPVGASSGARAPRRGGNLAMSLTWLGALLLLASAVLRGLAVMRVPVANLYEFAVAGCITTLFTYLIVSLRRPMRWLGLLVVLPVLSVLGVALVSWYVPAAELAPALDSYWIAIHVPIAIISIGIFTVAFAVLVAQMLVTRREHIRAIQGEAAGRSRLDAWPDSDRLDRIAYSLHVVAMPLWTFTIIAGAIWGQKAWGTYWSWDPKEVWSFVIWALYAAYLHARATSGWKRNRANLIAVAGYVAILLNVTVVNFFFSGLHTYTGVQ